MLFIHDVKCLQLEKERKFREKLKLLQHVEGLKPRTKHSRKFLFICFCMLVQSGYWLCRRRGLIGMLCQLLYRKVGYN